MNLEAEITRLRNELNALLAVVRPMPGGMQLLGNLQQVVSGTEYNGGIYIPLATPLASTSWDGDSFSTTAKTLIDLSAVFGTPANIKAVNFIVDVRDSASASNDTWFMLSPNDTANSGMNVSPLTINDRWGRYTMLVPCNADGDVYYQVLASGAGTMDVILQVWGYVV